VCRELTAEYASHVEYVHADSLDFFRRRREEGRGEIHFLYLDSLDYTDQEGYSVPQRLPRRCGSTVPVRWRSDGRGRWREGGDGLSRASQ
jgi:hypothetical protein